jgi:hypothetical protein
MTRPINNRKDTTLKTAHKLNLLTAALVGALAFTTATPMTQAQSHYDDLANLPFKKVPLGYFTYRSVHIM